MTAPEMPRDFVGYGRNPPKFEWPKGTRLALNIVVNFEEGAERNPHAMNARQCPAWMSELGWHGKGERGWNELRSAIAAL